ncbi:serine/threonine protein kinase [Blastococcus sp. TF02-09]|uniref:serine/threonine-protein kinase n=1 Tax=Blastococcus sp. TF02-09 TaxID=2250576 RepID=UPI000DEAC17E|nr:serine/threonine-protein kinase [Blastococcus sp. TF02-9]RBY79318.1 serine/threonine protein kinase [Blastococcus sp. TF02-9]
MPAAEPVAAPPVVPGYTVQELLGRGGSGEVWRAVPRRSGPPVAVKVLVEGEPQRQAREAALLGELDHPHLVRLVEVVHQPRRGGVPRVALVLDLLEGGSLGALLAVRGRLSPGEVVTVCAPVAAALAHVHAHGVVHGDLSPGNIVFTAEGRPVLTDLGVGRIIGETAAAEVTPAYVDPAVARGSAPGPASDVFGVAAAAFHALTGIAPWNAATPADTLVVAAHGHLPDLAELAPDAPPALLEVIGRGLSADPHDRGSAAAFALDLRHACRPEPVALTPGAVPGRGADPRTELTHVVPGRRPRPAPVVVEPPGRLDRWRAVLADHRPAVPLRVLVGTATALVVVALTAWLAVSWGSGDEPGTAVAAVTAPAPTAPGTATAPADAAPTPAEPGSAEEWAAVVTGLYGTRAQAFATASAELLDAVWADGSPQRAADEAHARSLAAAGERLRGFAPTVADVVVVSRSADRVELRLSDGWAAYEVVAADRPDGPAVRTEPARPVTPVQVVLVRDPAGWRLESAQRLG